MIEESIVAASQIQPIVDRGVPKPRTSDEIANIHQDVADYGDSEGEELEDVRGSIAREAFLGDKLLRIDHVDIKFKHRKDDDDEDSLSCFGRIVPNGERANLPQYLDLAMKALPSYAKINDQQVASKRATTENFCDSTELISRDPNAVPDEIYTEDSETLLSAIEYCMARNVTAHFAMKQFALMTRFIEAVMSCPVKPMMVFRNMNSAKDMFQVLITLAESSSFMDNPFDEKY